MTPRYEPTKGLFAVANPTRDHMGSHSAALAHQGLLRFCALGTRRGFPEVPSNLTLLNPKIGGAAYAARLLFSSFRAESFRFRLHPWFDRWVCSLFRPGDHIMSSFGYTNATFRRARQTGGSTFYAAGNSHPMTFWSLVQHEHDRWRCSLPPIARHQHDRVVDMLEFTDFVFSPSSFVSQSFLAHGFRPDQIIKLVFPVDLSCFTPATNPRPKHRPLTIISTGQLSLRKGTPYMLEAFRMIQRVHPSARFLLTDNVAENIRPVLAQYGDLSIEWAPGLPHSQLSERLRSADIFVLVSIEEGFVRTAAEALACGLPIIVTPNTGVNDVVKPENGDVVPIRDAVATAEALLKWADRVMGNDDLRPRFDRNVLSFEHFENRFLSELLRLNLIKEKDT